MPYVGAAQAVGQRVTPLLRMNSDIAASRSLLLIGESRVSMSNAP
jgi:hypothetical protein